MTQDPGAMDPKGDEQAKAAEALFREKFSLQCEKPCDSYGVCDNCMEVTMLMIGYERGYKEAYQRGRVDGARAEREELRLIISKAEIAMRLCAGVRQIGPNLKREQEFAADQLHQLLLTIRARAQAEPSARTEEDEG